MCVLTVSPFSVYSVTSEGRFFSDLSRFFYEV